MSQARRARCVTGADRYGGALLQVARLVWPRGDAGTRRRVSLALAMILIAKVASACVPLIYKQVIDQIGHVTAYAGAVLLVAGYGLARLAAQFAEEFRAFIFVRVAQRAVRLTARDFVRHLYALSHRFHLDRQTGGLPRTLGRGLAGVESLMEIGVFSLVPTAIEMMVVTGLLWRLYSAVFALTILVSIALYAWFTLAVTTVLLRRRQIMNRIDVEASVQTVDGLLNYDTVKFFGAEDYEVSRVDLVRETYEGAAVATKAVESALRLGQALIVTAGLVAVMLLAGRAVLAHQMTIGDFVLVGSYLTQLFLPLAALGDLYHTLQQSVVDAADIYELLGQAPEIQDREGCADLVVRAGAGRVTYDDVSFSYDGRKQILRGVSFTIEPGKTVAVVGATGSGKSTLAKLLFRFYDVEAGSILIDGQDLREVSQASLRRTIGFVPQDTAMFNNTVYFNIQYGDLSASREDVEKAARLAHIHDSILDFPDGYDTVVGERGLKLSGGEKQRIAIARVMLKNPPLLVLDEATSALDALTEADIQHSLRKLASDRSTLLIAHRLATVVDADEILVLDAGVVVERGTHQSLLSRNGVYASLWRRQRPVSGASSTVLAT